MNFYNQVKSNDCGAEKDLKASKVLPSIKVQCIVTMKFKVVMFKLRLCRKTQLCFVILLFQGCLRVVVLRLYQNNVFFNVVCTIRCQCFVVSFFQNSVFLHVVCSLCCGRVVLCCRLQRKWRVLDGGRLSKSGRQDVATFVYVCANFSQF